MRRILVVAGLAGAAVAAATGAVLFAGGEAKRPELQREVTALVTGSDRVAPGAAAFVAWPDGSWEGAAGLANTASGARMEPDARLRLESVSKPWTATLVLQLAAEGKLRLEDRVESRLPGALPDGDRITVRQLLDHTGGLIDNNDLGRDPLRYIRQVQDAALRSELLATKQALEADPSFEFPPSLWIRFAAALPLLSPPGTQYHYSNIGYEVAAAMVEKVAGEPLGSLYTERIIEPLELDSAAYDPQGEIDGPHARGYLVGDDGSLTDATAWAGGVAGAGGIVSNAADEARFLVALMQGELLRPPQLAALKRPSRVLGSSYALGLLRTTTPCGPAFTHNGGGAGFKTSVFVSGDGQRVAVLLLNGNTRDGRADAAAYAAAERLYCAA